jgi:hypothetical protein
MWSLDEKKALKQKMVTFVSRTMPRAEVEGYDFGEVARLGFGEWDWSTF